MLIRVDLRVYDHANTPDSDRTSDGAIQAATAWFYAVKLVGIATKAIRDSTQASGRDVIVVQDPNSTVWARFYELDTNRPFFCGRNGVKKYSLAKIEKERRKGYAWYGTWPAKLLAKNYPDWLAKWGK